MYDYKNTPFTKGIGKEIEKKNHSKKYHSA